MPETDGELVDRAKAGSLDAFETLLRRHQAVATRVAVVIAGPDDADDVLQEAYLRTHRNLDRFRAGAEFRPWLLAIVANQARNHRRSAWRRGTLALRVAARSPDLRRRRARRRSPRKPSAASSCSMPCPPCPRRIAW